MPTKRTWSVVGVLLGVLAIPLLIALVAVHHPRWYPVLDMAETELRVRDVASSHPPLIGLAGRIGPFGANGGSHPGPISFYALWPVYALLGHSAYGLQVSTVFLDLIALGLAIWIAFRRGGLALALGVTAVLAILTHTYGAFLLTQPWNPYMPVLWWFVFLLAIWSVITDDIKMLPVAIFAGTFCVQTHISYLGLVGGMVLVLAAYVGWSLYRRRADKRARRTLVRWSVISVGFGIVLWIPPILDEIVHSPGNATIIRDYFTNPPATDQPAGFHNGISILLKQLNPWSFVSQILVNDDSARAVSGARLPGVLLLLAFAVSVFVAWRMRDRAATLLRLDIVIAIGLLLGFISSARILGYVWFYLLLWAWGLVALMFLAIGWTIALAVRATPKSTRAGTAVLVAVIVVFATVFAVDAARINVASPRLNEEVAAIAPPTTDAVRALKRSGTPGPYLVTWLPDAQAIGSVGYGVFNELLRHGYDVRAPLVFPGATRYHIIDPSKAHVQVHVATGPDIERWRSDPRFREVTAFDPRTDAQRAEFDRLHGAVVSELEAGGHADLAPAVDDNLFMLALAPNLPTHARDEVTKMLAIGLPVAVFIGPPGDPT